MAAFNGDLHLEREVLNLRDRYEIQMAFETGTYEGDTTLWLASNFRHVYTAEVNEDYFTLASGRLAGTPNITCFKGNSPEMLLKHLEAARGTAFVFLDAHWYDKCPLLEEIATLRHAMYPPVVAIHDFHVPGTDFGYDSWEGHRLDLDYIRPALDSAFGPGRWRYRYNTEAEGARRGVIFIEPA